MGQGRFQQLSAVRQPKIARKEQPGTIIAIITSLSQEERASPVSLYARTLNRSPGQIREVEVGNINKRYVDFVSEVFYDCTSTIVVV